MSGHSKWSKVKHQKEGTDAVKGKLFTKLANAISVAVSEGGGNADPATNIKLRFAVEKARGSNMSKEKIERAIERGKGRGSQHLEEVLYEAFAPGGIGLLIQAATDNTNRTIASLKTIIDRGGGASTGSRAVSHLFTLVGKMMLVSEASFDSLFEDILECGAIDMEQQEDGFTVYTEHQDLHRVKSALSQKGYTIQEAELFYRPNIKIPVADEIISEQLFSLISAIEEHDDVMTVYANYDGKNHFKQ